MSAVEGCILRRFMLFAWSGDPCGGWRDFVSSFDSCEQATRATVVYDDWQVVDVVTGLTAAQGRSDGRGRQPITAKSRRR